MKKLISIFILIIFILSNSAFAFFKKKNNVCFILSGVNPASIKDFDKELKDANVFKVNDKIYYTIYNQDGFKSDYFKYQIIKQDDNAHVGGYKRIRNITIRLNDRNFYSDYFVLSQSGKYYIQIFDIVNLHHWVAARPFMVVD